MVEMWYTLDRVGSLRYQPVISLGPFLLVLFSLSFWVTRLASLASFLRGLLSHLL